MLESSSEVLETKNFQPSQVLFLARLDTPEETPLFLWCQALICRFRSQAIILEGSCRRLAAGTVVPKIIERLCQLTRGIDETCPSSSPSNERFDRSFFGGMIDIKPTELCDTDPEWSVSDKKVRLDCGAVTV